uniref:Uncharacterized protein n=1 Tax=Chelonoidis abingdonii TaxID=106734 RepID=A0A8C0IXQ3_CHEAB
MLKYPEPSQLLPAPGPTSALPAPLPANAQYPWRFPGGKSPAPTLLHVVDERLQLGVGLRFLPQGIQDHVVLGGASHIRLSQAPFQQADLGFFLSHLQSLFGGSRMGQTLQTCLLHPLCLNCLEG